METGFVLLGAAWVSLLGFLWIGVPILLTAWVRNRRREVATRQIALTDALDGALGMVVAPVVKKPLWGPWQVHIALPLSPPSLVSRVLAVTHEALSPGGALSLDHYRIVLTPGQESSRRRDTRPMRPGVRRPSDALAA